MIERERERKSYRKVRESRIARKRGGKTWLERGCGAAVYLCCTVPQLEELEGLSHISISLSFQTLAQRISEAHAHASANKHNAQSNPCRYRHALILTAKVLKM